MCVLWLEREISVSSHRETIRSPDLTFTADRNRKVLKYYSIKVYGKIIQSEHYLSSEVNWQNKLCP